MKYLYLFTFLVSIHLSFSQGFKVEGEVKDSTNNTSLSYANVLLRTAGDSTFRTDITDKDGRFKLSNVPAGNYTLSISFVGFKPYNQSLLVEKKDLDLGTIWLKESATNLEDHTIEGEAVEMFVKEDTLEYNAAAFTVTEGSELEELLKKMPGMDIKDGVITVNGKRIEKILVDGKPFFNIDIATMLRELPADLVKKIQVIDQKSEEAQFTGHDDGQRTPVMNIVSKPEKKKGYFGSMRGTLSPPGRYDFGGSISYMKGNNRYTINGSINNLNSESGSSIRLPVGFSSSDISRIMMSEMGNSSGIGSHKNLAASIASDISEKLELSTSLRWSNDNSYSQSDISREYIQASDEGRVYNEQSERERNNTNVTASISAIYKPSKKDQITFSQSFSSATMLTSSWKKGETILNDRLLNSTDNRSYMENDRKGYNTRLAWRHKFSREGRTFSLDFANSNFKSEGADSIKSENIFTDGNIQEQIFDQVSAPDDLALTRSISMTLTEKVGENSSFMLRYNNVMEEDSNKELLFDFNEQNQAYTELDPIRSSQFKLTNQENNLTANYSIRLEGLNISPRFTYKHLSLNNDQVYPREADTRNTFKGLNPGISLYKTSEKGRQFQLNLSRSMTAPRAEQLQDVLDNSNPLFLRQGNPNLSSGFNNNLSMTYMVFNEENSSYSSIQLSANTSENATTNYTIVGNGSNGPPGLDLPVGVRYSRPINISGAKNLNMSVSTSRKAFKEKLNIGYGLSFDYSYDPQYLNELLQFSETMAYSMNFSIRSDFSEKITLHTNIMPRFSTVRNSSPEEPNSEFFSWTGMANARWTVAEEFYITSNLGYSYNGGVSNLGSFDRLIWSASLGKKILKKKLDINIMANDILKQASDQDRSISAEYIENSSTLLLRQIFRFTINYRFSKFG